MDETVHSLIYEKIAEGENWLSLCKDKLANVPGIDKLIRKVTAEVKFLKRLRALDRHVPLEYIHSSNLLHLTAIIQSACQISNLVCVLQTFHYTLNNNTSKIVVDVVGDNGYCWIKVIARNPNSMNQAFHGQGHFGDKNIVEHGKYFMTCALQNKIVFKIPAVHFHFYNGVTEDVSCGLSVEGVAVSCIERNSFCVFSTESTPLSQVGCEALAKYDHTKTLNLDVSTMLAYISSLTNGGCFFKFEESILTEQAACERRNPVKVILDSLFAGRILVCCETAIRDFNDIVNKVGGGKEKQRSCRFLEKVVVVPDGPILQNLKIGGKIKKRSLLTFGTGETIRAITVTANAGFVRAARSQGYSVQAFIHESRALSEVKEVSALRLTGF